MVHTSDQMARHRGQRAGRFENRGGGPYSGHFRPTQVRATETERRGAEDLTKRTVNQRTGCINTRGLSLRVVSAEHGPHSRPPNANPRSSSNRPSPPSVIYPFLRPLNLEKERRERKRERARSMEEQCQSGVFADVLTQSPHRRAISAAP